LTIQGDLINQPPFFTMYFIDIFFKYGIFITDGNNSLGSSGLLALVIFIDEFFIKFNI